MKTNKIVLLILLVIVGLIIVFNGNLLGQKEIDTLSKEKAVKLLEEKYELAGSIYSLSNEYFVLSDEEKSWEHVGYTEYGREITNYEDIVKNNFTEKMIKDFEKNAIFLEIIDGKAYVILGGLGFSTYEGVEEFKDINITDNKITSTVKTKHNDDIGNFYGYIESTFTLVKNGDNWLIDEFDSSDIFNADLDKVISNTKSDNYIALFNGIEIYKNTGVQEFEWVENTEANKEKYNTKYYNYEKNEYKGETEGVFGNEEVYVGTSYVENVSKFAISKNYNAMPRQSTVIDELPDELNDMMDYSNVEIESIDLDGDGKTEYIVATKKQH